ncbi:MAG: Ig-like domain-containing protein, partial [Dokdonella sp.]
MDAFSTPIQLAGSPPCSNATIRLSCIRLKSLLLVLLFGLLMPLLSQASVPVAPAALVTVPNGDFSDANNNGSIGGAALAGSGSGVIGAGPWGAAYSGIATILAQPTLTIGSGHAQIGGLLGINVGGILNNQGRFLQSTGVAWQPNRRYTLEADIDAGSVLAANVLTSGNVGIALATGVSKAARVSESTSGSPTLTLISGNTYRLKIEYLTGASVSGNIFLQLFAEPSGLIGVTLLGSVDFDNVSLHTYLLTQVPASIVPANAGPYTGTVGGVVDPDIGVVVLDALGDPISGVSVSFAVPSSGPSATVVPNPAITDANGVAHVTTTANTIAGNYQIIATVTGVPTPIVYNMTNLAGPPTQVSNVGGGGQGATAGTAFTTPVTLQVQDQYGNPVSGVQVTFTPPASGASSSFSPNPATTDANGNISVTATANTIAGTYNVGVSFSGIATPTSFQLTNLAGPAASVGSVSGGNQGAVTSTVFATPLGLQVLDQHGNPVAGVLVTFTAPGTGASASLSPVSVMSDANGFVSTTATANAIAGNYVVDVSVAGLGTVAQIPLTNLLDPTITIADVGESGQNASIGSRFSCLLLVEVVNAGGDPMQGMVVDFTAPTSGASATLSNGSASGMSLEIATDVDGLAWVEATANGTEGEYTVSAQLKYSLAPAKHWHLRNLAAN